MRFIILMSAGIIAEAINPEYIKSRESTLIILGMIALIWDMFGILCYLKKKILGG